MKICSKCKQNKELNEFHNNKTRPDGKEVYCNKCAINRVAKWKKNNISHTKEYNRVRRFIKHGITEKQYLELLFKQNNACAICDIKSTNLEIDHNHKCCPGIYSCGSCIRGLLCTRCNITLGALEENRHIIQNMIKYLEGPLV